MVLMDIERPLLAPSVLHATPAAAFWEARRAASLDEPTFWLSLVAHRLSVRASRPELRALIGDVVYENEPGSAASWLRDASRADVARVRTAVLRALIDAIRDVAESAIGPARHDLLRAAADIESRQAAGLEKHLEHWIGFSLMVGVPPANFLQTSCNRGD